MYDTVLCAVGIAILIAVDTLKEYKIDLKEKIVSSPLILKYATLMVIIFCIFIFGAYGDGYIPVDPIYGGF